MHVDVLGNGPRVVLVHGSVGYGLEPWQAQMSLAERFTLVVPTRSGYPPNPPLDSTNFDDQAADVAELIEPGDHLVGHSYGGVVSLLAATQRADALASLTVIEPPAFAVTPDHPAVQEFVAAFEGGHPQDPAEYLRFFLPLVGSTTRLPEPLPPELEAGARTALRERYPTEAEIQLDDLRAAAFRKLVVSGGHHATFDAVCDVLERELGAERAVISGAGHSVARTGKPFNDVLVDFIERAGRRD